MAIVQSNGGQGGDLARLEGPVRLVVPYSGAGVAAGVATQGGVYDAWFRVGGTRALLYTAARCEIHLAQAGAGALIEGCRNSLLCILCGDSLLPPAPTLLHIGVCTIIVLLNLCTRSWRTLCPPLVACYTTWYVTFRPEVFFLEWSDGYF